MDTGQALGHEGGHDGAFGETLAGEGLVGESQLIDLGKELGRVRAGHLANALGVDLRLLPERLLDDESIRKRVEYDIYYIENWSIGLDIQIILLTFLKGFVNKNAY